MERNSALDILKYFFALISAIYIPSCNGAQCHHVNTNIKGCTSTMNVSWMNSPPYITRVTTSNNSTTNTTNEIEGILKDLIESIVRKCCGRCVRFRYLKPLNNSKEMINEVHSMTSQSILSYPILGKSTDLKFFHLPYYPIIESPGMVFLRNKRIAMTATDTIMESITSGWPIMVLCLVLAAMAGITINLLDHHWNPEHFPRPFYRGSWEGFWWAFVTMATVGYGDRAPLSFHARLFSFFWALTGLTVCGLFTGTVSSNLTSFSLTTDVKLIGKKVVVFNKTMEERYALKNNAETVIVNTIDEFIGKIQQDPDKSDIYGGLIDSYVAGHYKEKLSAVSNIIEFGKVIDYQYTYGFILSQLSDDITLQKCLRNGINETEITRNVLRNLKALPEPKVEEGHVLSHSLLNGRSRLFLKVVYICVGAIAVLLLGGLSWEYFYFLPKKRREETGTNKVEDEIRTQTFGPTDSVQKMISQQSYEFEEMVLNEVRMFREKFREKLDEVRNGDAQ